MKNFAYLTALDLTGASKALAAGKGAVAKGGGTDLLDLLKERILEPDEVVNLLRAKRDAREGELSALLTLDEVASHPWVKENFPAVAKAASESPS